ncbi:MAG TPA: glycosyltransferase family 39 protein [Pyrinomonadaceae bacterium]|nr:glycosyltransferase family 39 protein [Pyrinomonadaceae bacterium]
MSAPAATVTTASITPELFPERIVRSSSRAVVVSTLALVMLLGFGLRAYRLGAEGLSEDELNKVRAVEEYRTRGLSSANGEHPFLMKAMLTASVVAADAWNASGFARARGALQISNETAVRLPAALVGALTALLIFLVTTELFGAETGLLAAMLWAFDPAAIGFNRIAKEDSFLVFFFLLANVFWLRGQRAAEEGRPRPERFYWAAAAAFGAMLASKYVPHFIAISGAYYYIFQGIKATRWRMGKRKWLLFFAVMGAAFLVCNPTILLPGTWHEMRVFAGEKRIGHDSYEFMGALYRNQMTLWLKGSPWYFYYVFMGVKLPLPILFGFVAGLPLLFLKRLGDGRFFILFWLFFWFFPFTLMGGKFTRYFTFALPAVLMTASIGIHAAARWLAQLTVRLNASEGFNNYVRACFALAVVAFSAYASASAAPHYRLYTNALGGGRERTGDYFPHDEFYDASTREVARFIAQSARPGARVASETPELVAHYARLYGRADLAHVSLSDRAALREFAQGDIVIIARGRRYFSNDAVTSKLLNESEPAFNTKLGDVLAARVYVLDTASLALMSSAVKQ